MPTGRFAPSPTGPLHLGNLRTALLAWLFARSTASTFLVRMEDLDPGSVREEHVAGQLSDLAAVGLDWDGPVVRQSQRLDRYVAAIAMLEAAGLTYPCFCSRREIREAASAPHGPSPDGAYPGTCRHLGVAEQTERAAAGRPAALRLRAGAVRVTVVDRLSGEFTAEVDDLVLRRGDGMPAYNLAVVMDDAAQGVGEVVRGDDLLTSTPRQVLLAQLLGLPIPEYAHVPLALGPGGERLAKRDGSVTLSDLGTAGVDSSRVLGWLAESLGLASAGETVDSRLLLRRFDPNRVPKAPWMPISAH